MQIALKNYSKLLSQLQKIIKQTEQNIVKSVNRQKVVMAWQIGKEIGEHLQKNSRADYGKKLFSELEKDTKIAQSILYQMRNFYKSYPTLPLNENDLSWSHYRSLAAIENNENRKILEDLTVKNKLSAGDLQREISELKKAEKNKLKKPRRKNNSSEGVKLKVTRGQLFTYKINAPSEIDLGFNIFVEVKNNFKSGEIISTKKVGEKISLKKSAVKSKQLHTYKAKLERVVDGDTLHVKLDLGFEVKHREILRLTQINAPEFKTAAGKKSSDALKKILKNVKFLIVKTNKTDIYGRYLADVFFDESGKEKDLQKVAERGTYLSQLLLDRKLVEKY